MQLGEDEEQRLIEIERLKTRHNRTVWQRVAKKQVEKIKFDKVNEENNKQFELSWATLIFF